MAQEDVTMLQIVENFRIRCSSAISLNARMLQPRQREPKATMKDLLPLLGRKPRKKRTEANEPNGTIYHLRKVDVVECQDIINKGPDGTSSLVSLLTGFDAKTVDAVRDAAGNGILHLLVSRGYRLSIKFLHSLGCNMNETSSSGFSGVALACRMADLETLRHLVDLGANVALKGPDGKTSLHWAVIGGDVEVTKYILSVSRDFVDARDDQGMTALHYAASICSPEMCKILIGEGGAISDLADVNGVDAAGLGVYQQKLNDWLRGALALTEAVVSQSKGPVKDEKLRWAAVTEETGIINVLIGMGMDPSLPPEHSSRTTAVIKQGKLASKKILECGSLSEIRLAVAEGGCVNTVDEISGLSPLHLSVIKGSVDVLSFLIDQKADVNKLSEKSKLGALEFAAVSNNGIECMKILLKAGAHVTPAVMSACISGGSAACLDALARKTGHHILEDPIGGEAPIAMAARSGKTEICLYMMHHKVRPDTTHDAEGRNAFLIACAAGQAETACGMGEEMLRQHQLHAICCLDNSGRNGLILLAMSDFREEALSIERFLDLICAAGMSLDHEDCLKRPALVHAAKVGNELLCEALVARGASAGLMDLMMRFKKDNRPVIRSSQADSMCYGMGLKRDQNVEYLSQQKSSPLGLRFENIPSSFDSKTFAEWLINRGSRPVAVRVVFDPFTGKPCMYAYASFSERGSMQTAAKLSGHPIGDRRLKVYIDEALLSGTAPENVLQDWTAQEPSSASNVGSTSKVGRNKSIRFST